MIQMKPILAAALLASANAGSLPVPSVVTVACDAGLKYLAGDLYTA